MKLVKIDSQFVLIQDQKWYHFYYLKIYSQYSIAFSLVSPNVHIAILDFHFQFSILLQSTLESINLSQSTFLSLNQYHYKINFNSLLSSWSFGILFGFKNPNETLHFSKYKFFTIKLYYFFISLFNLALKIYEISLSDAQNFSELCLHLRVIYHFVIVMIICYHIYFVVQVGHHLSSSEAFVIFTKASISH